MEGQLPRRALNLVREWAMMHKRGTPGGLAFLPGEQGSDED